MRPEPGRRNTSRSGGHSANTRNSRRPQPKRRVRRRPNEVAKRRRKRKFNEALGKFIPVFLAIAAIIAIVSIFYGNKILDRYRYSGKHADLKEYYGVYYDYQVAMVINNARVEEKGVYYKNSYYISHDDVKKYFTNHFYINLDEQLCLYTTQDEIIRADINQTGDYCYYK